MGDAVLLEHDGPDGGLSVQLPVSCSRTVFERSPVSFDRWAPLNYLVGPNGSGKTTLFNSIMDAARGRWPNRVKILGTGRLSPLEKSVSQWIGDPASRLFADDNIQNVYNNIFGGTDTSHQAFQLLEKRLDLQIRVLGFLRHVFKRTLHFKSTRRGLQILGATATGSPYQLMDECHGLKELITLLTFLYDDTFSVLGIDEPELHLHPQFQRFLLDELRKVAGSPEEQGKKLIFLVTHSPILLELRELRDLESVIVFTPGAPPQRAELSRLSSEESLKVRQALPAFHASQRELVFSNTPIVVEGHTDAAVILNVTTRLNLPIGAAGIGVAPMGGKQQFLAFRALLGSFAKPHVRFILDLDAAIDTKLLNAIDNDGRVIHYLQENGAGERTLTKVAGELKSLLQQFAAKTRESGSPPAFLQVDDQTLTDRHLALTLAWVLQLLADGPDALVDVNAARTIKGKCDLVRSAARAANVLILGRGAIEAYYRKPLRATASDFDKQQAFQEELDAIWTSEDQSALRSRYAEILKFIEDAGLLRVPFSEMVREPIANLVHLLQTEIAGGRIATKEEAVKSSRAVAEGYWDVCQLTDLSVNNRSRFSGTIQIKPEFGNAAVHFDHNTKAYEVAAESDGSDA